MHEGDEVLQVCLCVPVNTGDHFPLVKLDVARWSHQHHVNVNLVLWNLPNVGKLWPKDL